MIGRIRIRRERLRVRDRLFGLQEIVEAADLREIDREHVVAEKIAERPIHSPTLHVAGCVKRDDAGVHVVEEDIEVRRPGLVHDDYFEIEAAQPISSDSEVRIRSATAGQFQSSAMRARPAAPTVRNALSSSKSRMTRAARLGAVGGETT